MYNMSFLCVRWVLSSRVFWSRGCRREAGDNVSRAARSAKLPKRVVPIAWQTMHESGLLAQSGTKSRRVEVDMASRSRFERQENSFWDRHPWSLHPKVERWPQLQSSECRSGDESGQRTDVSYGAWIRLWELRVGHLLGHSPKPPNAMLEPWNNCGVLCTSTTADLKLTAPLPRLRRIRQPLDKEGCMTSRYRTASKLAR